MAVLSKGYCLCVYNKMRVDKNMKLLSRQSRAFVTVAHIVACFALVFPLASCSDNETEVVAGYEDIANLPTLYTRDVVTLISDSGITRYRIEAPSWYMYDNASDPYWYFPNGLKVEQFDTLFATETFIQGDTAIYYKKRQLWQLDRNVHIENAEGRVFDTQQLFWDQKERKIYSDSAICITSEEEVIEGIGFVSNEQISKYAILQTKGIFTVKQDTVPKDSVDADTELLVNE